MGEAKKGWEGLGAPQVKEELLQTPLGGSSRAQGEALAGALGISLDIICFRLYKNKLRGGGSAEGRNGGRWGRARPGSSQKNNSSPLARSQEKAAEHPQGQEAPEPGKKRLHGPCSCHGPQRWACLSAFSGAGKKGGWDEKKHPGSRAWPDGPWVTPARLRPPHSGRFSRAWKHKTSHAGCQGGVGPGLVALGEEPGSGRGPCSSTLLLQQLRSPLPKPLLPQEQFVTSLCSSDSFGVFSRAQGQELQ